MTAADDDDSEALAWAGDESLTPEPKPSVGLDLPTGALEDGDSAETDTASKPMPAALLVTYGVLAGIYLIYVFGWIISVTRSTVAQSDLLAEIMYQFGEFLAIASPAIWFFSVLYLTRGRRSIIRMMLLLAGLIATIPWPLVLGL